MIRFTTGNILVDPSEAILNTVNCVGVMGKGLALQFKNAYPDNFIAYVDACKEHRIHLGKMFVWKNTIADSPKYIINFPTKYHWSNCSYLSDIRAGLKDLYRIIIELNILSIAIPPLGVGLGGLPWVDVRDIITMELFNLRHTVEITIYEPWREKIREHARLASILDEDTTFF